MKITFPSIRQRAPFILIVIHPRMGLTIAVFLLTMTSGEINMDAVREVHPLKSIGCFIKKPITADALVKHIRVELE